MAANNLSNNKSKNNNKNNTKNNSKNNTKEVADTEVFSISEQLGKNILANQSTRIIFMSIIFLIIFFGFIGFFFHNSITRKVQTISNKTIPLFNDTEELIDASLMNPSFNLRQSYIMYINFDNSGSNHSWFSSFHSSKMIFHRIDDNLEVLYQPHSNKLLVKIAIKKLDIETRGSGTEEDFGLHPSHEYVYVPDIPHHTWLQIAIVIDNRMVDIYINKKLAVSRILENVPILSNNSIRIGKPLHNSNAFLGRLEYANDLVTPMDLKALYFKNMNFLSIDPLMRKKIVYDSHNLIHHQTPSPSV